MPQKKNVKMWTKHWAGRWHLLNNSLLGYQYTKLLKKELGQGLDEATFICHKHYSVAYINLTNYKKFALFLAKNVLSNQKQVSYWTELLRLRTNAILSVIKKLEQKHEVNAKDYQEFITNFYAYGLPHRVIKIVVDALPPKKLEKFLPELSKARVYAEPVYAETENFIEFLAKQISTKINYTTEQLLCVTWQEMDTYWKTGKLPNKAELSSRWKASAIIYKQGKSKLLFGNNAVKLEKSLNASMQKTNFLQGATAYPGKITGRVEIVLNPHTAKNFKKGSILVTGMTRPEYLPLLKLSAGFITDAGGMLSHAAITARELKKPCIVGTQIATKKLKDGFIVELDATTGLIKIIK